MTQQLSDQELLDEICQIDFLTFAGQCFRELHNGAMLEPNWHLDVVAHALATAALGSGSRSILNVSPRSLKSMLGSVALVAWLLGKDPGMRIICVSYAQDLANALSRDCRIVMRSRWYRRMFPGTRLADDKAAVNEFATTKGGSRKATSIGGVLTGYGADLIIIDDPLKPDEAGSEVQRNGINNWFKNTLLSRLNNKKTGNIIVIMQRIHEDDLTGHLLDQQSGWKVLALPAIAEVDEVHVVESELGTIEYHRKAGEALHPEREPLSVYAELRRNIGEYNFAGQYQQSPAPAEGGLIKRAWLTYYGHSELPKLFDGIVQSWDTANKVSELSDYSVCTTWGIAEKRLFLLDVRRERLDYPELKRAVRAHAEKYAANTVLIEDKASGTQLIQELTQDNLHSIRGYTPEGDKIMRMHATSILFENGAVRLPRSAPWLNDYERELTNFPKGKHDDQVDSTSQALAWFQKAQEIPAIIQYYDKLLRERDQQKEQRPVVTTHSCTWMVNTSSH